MIYRMDFLVHFIQCNEQINQFYISETNIEIENFFLNYFFFFSLKYNQTEYFEESRPFNASSTF